MAATATLLASITALLEGAVDIGTVRHNVNFGPSLSFGSGTGANQITDVFADTRTLAASTGEDLDLAGGLTNAIGQAITFTKVRGLLVRAAAANTNNVIVGNASSNGWITAFGGAAHTITVRPGGILLLAAPDVTGYAVTAGTGDLLRIANSSSGSAVTYDIVILGTT